DQTIGQAEIRKNSGVSVVGVLRDDQLEPNPGPDFRFRARDLVAVIGSGQARDAFRERFFADGPALDLAA
ncbi:MAG: portal protein, partial [Desulfobulbaceae bacterium]|nr:portal protein [Desulfobulbaceae bacterium]